MLPLESTFLPLFEQQDYSRSSLQTVQKIRPRLHSLARRSKDWNVGLAQDLRDKKFARQFLLAAIEEGVLIQIALGKVIRAIGIKEFSAIVGIAGPNLLRAINPRHNPTQETLNRLLKPFKLRLSLAPIEEPKRHRAA